MFLSKEDLQALTGFTRRSAQVRWLRSHGYRFTVNGIGDPVVAVAEMQRHMVGGGATKKKEPNFQALNG